MTTNLRLYIVGGTLASERALGAIDALRDRLGDGAEIEVVDLRDAPQIAEEQKILATPLLVRLDPPPVRRLAGDLSDPDRVAWSLGLRSEP
jgi:circadian clock protein KaiB